MDAAILTLTLNCPASDGRHSSLATLTIGWPEGEDHIAQSGVT